MAVFGYAALYWYQRNDTVPKGDDVSTKNAQDNRDNKSASNTTLAPDIELKTLQNGQFQLSKLRGRVVILNFWATWCIPCRTEIPELNSLQKDFGPRGLEVVGVSWDDTAEDIKEFQKDIKQNYLVVLGGETVQDKFGGIPSLPTTYIIDRKGQVREKIIGARDRSGFDSMVRPLIEETP